MTVNFDWTDVCPEALITANGSKDEDELFGFVPVCVDNDRRFIIDLHHEYYPGYGPEFKMSVYKSNDMNQHLSWIDDVMIARTATDFKMFCHKTENAAIRILRDARYIPNSLY